MYKNCKTEESFARQRAIENAFLLAMGVKSYEKITLNSLCMELDIPRKSLYRYFPTKRDILLGLIDHRLSDCNALVFFGWEGKAQFQKANLERFFSFWFGEKEFLDAIVENNFWPLLLERTTRIVDTMKETGTAPREQSFAREQVDYFISYGLMTTVLRWYHLGYPGTPEELAAVFSSILCAPEIAISRLFL